MRAGPRRTRIPKRPCRYNELPARRVTPGSGRADEPQQLLPAPLPDLPGDRAEMPANRDRRQAELARDLQRRQAAREELQHLRLALGERDRDAADREPLAAA